MLYASLEYNNSGDEIYISHNIKAYSSLTDFRAHPIVAYKENVQMIKW